MIQICVNKQKYCILKTKKPKQTTPLPSKKKTLNNPLLFSMQIEKWTPCIYFLFILVVKHNINLRTLHPFLTQKHIEELLWYL